MLLNGVTVFDEGLGAVGAGGGGAGKFGGGKFGGVDTAPDLSPGWMVVLILRFNCWKEFLTPLEGRSLGSEGGAGGSASGLDSGGGIAGGPDFSGRGTSVVV